MPDHAGTQVRCKWGIGEIATSIHLPFFIGQRMILQYLPWHSPSS
jgi:hypothetical protein